MHKKSFNSSESGYGNSEGSAIDEYFKKIVPQLSSYADEDDDELLDPTIDLDAVAVCKPPPPASARKENIQRPQNHHHHQQQRTQMIRASSNSQNSASFNSTNNGHNRSSQNSENNHNATNNSARDLSMSELGLIVGQMKDGGPYSQKLVTIMLKGLEKTLTSNVYRLFLEFGLPENWCPIVKMNNDNTPFVEFLIKSDLSDQDPFSQLNEYSTDHMALCQFIVKQLQEKATRCDNQLLPANQHHQTKNHTTIDRQRLRPMSCSTPKHQRSRVLPPRACKSAKNDQKH